MKIKTIGLRLVALLSGFVFALSVLTFRVSMPTKTNAVAEDIRVYENVLVQVDEDAVSSTHFAGGEDIDNPYRLQPNVKLTGLPQWVETNFDLAECEDNKDLLLINGKSWRHWESCPYVAVGEFWLYKTDSNVCYFGFDCNGALQLSAQNGGQKGTEEIETLKTIIIKRGFRFIGSYAGNGTNDAVAILTENILLQVNESGGFDVIADLKTETQLSTERYGKITANSVSIYSEPDPEGTVLGAVTTGTELLYLEDDYGGWCNVEYNGVSAWVSGRYYTVTGPKTIEVQTPITLYGYTLTLQRDVEITALQTYVMQTPTDVGAETVLATAEYGNGYRYLEEEVNGYYKIQYGNDTGWILKSSTRLSVEYVEILPLNEPWEESADSSLEFSISDGLEEDVSESTAFSSDANSTTESGNSTTEKDEESNVHSVSSKEDSMRESTSINHENSEEVDDSSDAVSSADETSSYLDGSDVFSSESINIEEEESSSEEEATQESVSNSSVDEMDSILNSISDNASEETSGCASDKSGCRSTVYMPTLFTALALMWILLSCKRERK